MECRLGWVVHVLPLIFPYSLMVVRVRLLVDLKL